jgi:outer membrane receptor protein involved in Fe transport
VNDWDRKAAHPLLVVALLGTAVTLVTTSAVGDVLVRGTKAPVLTQPGPSGGYNPRDTGYFVPYVTGPGGTRVPVMEVPGAVTVVPRSLMDDQQATTLGEALRNVPGVFVGR